LKAVSLLSDKRRQFTQHRLAALIAVSFATLLVPFLFVDIPPMTDLPNHLARFWLIGDGGRDPIMARYYRVDWSNAVTNIGVDRAVALLSPWFTAFTLGRTAAVSAAIIAPIGVLGLNLALYRRLSPWQALFPLAAWSTTLLMGFLNFQIGIGLALVFAAMDPIHWPRAGYWWRLVRLPMGLVLATDHLFGLFFYSVLLAGLGVGPGSFAPWSVRIVARRLGKGAREAAFCILPLLAVAAHPHTLPGAQMAPGIGLGSIQYNIMPGKLATLLSVLASYNVAQELVVATALIMLFIWLNHIRALWAHAGLMLATAGLVAAAILSPSHASGASWVDRRFPIMALLCVLAALRLRDGLPRRAVIELGAATLALSSLQSAWVAWNWRALQDNIVQVETLLAKVPAGARVMPLQHDPALGLKLSAPAGRYIFGVGDPTFRHYDALAVPLRRAFVPNLFAAKGLQPLRVIGDWDRYVEHNGGDAASVSVLSRAIFPGEASYAPYWRDRFDYVLILNTDMPDQSGPFVPPQGLTLVASQHFAELWRVSKAP